MQKLNDIKLLLVDVDGVLTDGRITYSDSGEQIKSFDVKDGLGIRLLQRAGIKVGIITARTSAALGHRVNNLGIELFWEGVDDKAAILETACRQAGVTAAETAFIGDDLMDLSLFKHIGLSIAVADAHPTVLEKAAMVTSAGGGKGAVREVCDAILKSKGLWESLIDSLEQPKTAQRTA